jgi:hypothetical protein
MTSPGIAVGTVAYIAPEQARGETPAPPADIYAFGIMLIEALTGTRPFADAEGIGTVMARLTSPPTIPETLHPAWQGLLRGMTSTQPEDRPTALEVAVAARRLAENDDAAIQPADQPTVAMTPLTDRTAVLPAASAAPGAVATMAVPAAEDPVTPRATSPVAAAMVALSEHPSGPLPLGRSAATRAQRARRRRAAFGVAIAVVALLIAIAGAAWVLSLAGQPSPEPTTPAVIQPSEDPVDAPVEQEPAPVDQGGDDTDNSGPGNGGGGNGGGGNGNSGPGNNNGNGNGGGNGGGNGNSGPGNNNGNG